MKKILTRAHRGYLMLLALVFGAVFLAVFGGLSVFVLSENRLETAHAAKSQSLALAEAGLEYYHWHLARFPNDVQNGTGHAGPYSMSYADPEGGTAGTISLSIAGNTYCGQVSSVDLTSTGVASSTPSISATLRARYAQPSVASYSYILNDSVWAGSDRVINGPYHANGGIRMDGTANAPVTSSVSTWSCTPAFGCVSTTTENGVFGSGPNSNLWSYPSASVNFSQANLATLKAAAQASGKYLARTSTGNSGANANKGWHLTFNSNGTVSIQQVTGVTALTPSALVNFADGSTDYTLINTQNSASSYTLPASCGLIYVDDNVWIEGTVKGKVTVVAGNIASGIATNAIIRGNVSYADTSSGLTVMAQNDVLLSADSPNNMTINAVMVALAGAFGRNYYANATYDSRNTLTITGTTVSNKRTGTKWCLNQGCTVSTGYQTRIDSYDRRLSTDPPPYTPVVSTDFKFVSWSEQ